MISIDQLSEYAKSDSSTAIKEIVSVRRADNIDDIYATRCYEHIKAEKGWSSNQFAEYASKYSAYWLKLVSVSSSDLTQSLFSFFNISLFNIIFLSTSHSTRVTNTFSSSLAQSLNIT